MDRIESAIRIYTVQHHGPPANLAALGLAGGYDDCLVSPFDRAAGDAGYAFLPQNLRPGEWLAYLYDVAELRQTGSTHAVSKVSDNRIVTHQELDEWTGAAVPSP